MGSWAEFAAEVQVRRHLAESGCSCRPTVVLSPADGDVWLGEVEHAAGCETVVVADESSMTISEVTVRW